jgi:hypothetical protein
MGRLSSTIWRSRAAVAAALLVGSLTVPAGALAKENLDCPGKHTLVRVDEKVCPATPDRPLLVIKRACCQNPAGKVHCRHFEHCPSKSPS